MKILMRLFDLQEERFYCYASENTSSLSRDNKTFYINNFKVNFVENNPAAFAEMLYQVCARHDPPLLRQTATGHKLSFKEIIRKMIGRGELAEALEKLEEYCTEQQLDQQLDEVYLQSGRLSKLQKQITKNLITNQEAERETSRITQAVLDITGSLQEKV